MVSVSTSVQKCYQFWWLLTNTFPTRRTSTSAVALVHFYFIHMQIRHANTCSVSLHTHTWSMPRMWLGLWWCHLTSIQCCMLAQMKAQEVGEIFKSCPRARRLNSRAMCTTIHSYPHICCSSAQAVNSSCQQPWNSNSPWTLADWRVELQAVLYQHVRQCTNIHLHELHKIWRWNCWLSST